MRRAPGLRISRSAPSPVKRPIGLRPSRIGETPDHAPRANATTAALPAIEAQASAWWKGVRSFSGDFLVSTTRIAWRTVLKVTTPR